MESEGQSMTAIRDKLLQFYQNLPEEKRNKWRLKYTDQCTEWIKEVTNAQEFEEIKSLKEAKNVEALKKKFSEYKLRLPKPRLEMVELWQKECDELLEKKSKSDGRYKRLATDQDKQWTWWMNEQQRSELEQMRKAGKSYKEIHDAMEVHFNKLDGPIKEEIISNYIRNCREYLSTIATGTEKSSLIDAFDANNSEQFIEIMKHIIEKQQSEETRQQAQRILMICQDVSKILHSRPKRDIDALMEKHLKWLSDEQKNEIKQMKADDQSMNAIKAKLLEYVEKGGQHLVEKTYESCYAWLHDVTSADERVELEKLHEIDHNACKSKVREYIRRLPAAKQEAVNRDLDICEEIWYSSHSHHGHQHQTHAHHHHHQKRLKRSESVDEYIEQHFQWMSEEQRAELHKMHADGKSRAEMLDKAVEFYENIHGETKKAATKQLRAACDEVFKKILEQEHFDELTKMCKANAKSEGISARVEKLFEAITDEEKKAKAKLYRPVCEKIYQAVLRDEHEFGHTFEDYFKILDWISKSQQVELKKMKEDNKTKAEMLGKIVDIYRHLNGEYKKRASEQLIDGCRKIIKDAIGEKHTNYILMMIELGASAEELRKKIIERVDASTNEKARQRVKDYRPICIELLGPLVMDKRQENFWIKHYLAGSLSWLSESQREHLKDLMINDTEIPELKALIFEHYEKLNDSRKQCATSQLKRSCNRLYEQVIGCEKVGEIRRLYEAHVSSDEISDKIEHFFTQVTDNSKKEMLEEYGDFCRKIYKNWAHNELERELSMQHSLTQLLQAASRWMNKSQMDEIRKMKSEMIAKVISFYDGLEGAKKASAAKVMRKSCGALVRRLIGDEHFNELVHLKNSGADFEELSTKLDQLFSESNHPAKEELLAEYGDKCKKIREEAYNYDEHDAKVLNESFSNILEWLSDEQKMRILKMYRKDHMDEGIQYQVIHYLNDLSSDKKASVVELMHTRCHNEIKDIVGEENYEKLKKMFESGASNDELKHRMEEMVDETNDEEKKVKIEKFGIICRHAIKLAHSSGDSHSKREKRDDIDEENLKKYFQSYLSWLSKEQREQILKMKHDGATKDSMRKVVFEHYNKLSGAEKKHATELLANGCRFILAEVIGSDKMEQLKHLRDTGVSVEQVGAVVKQMLEEVNDPVKKEKIHGYQSGCDLILRESFEASANYHHAHDLEHYFSTHLSWLSDEQKRELRSMQKENASREAMQEKILNYFESAQADVKKTAIEKLYEGCNRMIVHVLGQEKSTVLKEMRDHGESFEKLVARFNELIAEVTDHGKRESAEIYKTLCSKVYKQRMAETAAA